MGKLYERVHGMIKSARTREIERLDPYKEDARIVRISVMYEFPWDYARSLEMALLKTFAVPSISSILYKSGEFTDRPGKRYDDTDLILSEILEYGYGSERGLRAIERMNWIHDHYRISNQDYVYVLTTFIVEPIRWIERFGWRQPLENERIAAYRFWVHVGELMGIENIPGSIEQAFDYHDEYERKYFRYRPENKEIADSILHTILSWHVPLNRAIPAALEVVKGALEEPLLDALGYDRPSAVTRSSVQAAMKARSAWMALAPKRKRPFRRTAMPRKYYREGFKFNDLGPEMVVGKACPYHALRNISKTV